MAVAALPNEVVLEAVVLVAPAVADWQVQAVAWPVVVAAAHRPWPLRCLLMALPLQVLRRWQPKGLPLEACMQLVLWMMDRPQGSALQHWGPRQQQARVPQMRQLHPPHPLRYAFSSLQQHPHSVPPGAPASWRPPWRPSADAADLRTALAAVAEVRPYAPAGLHWRPA